MATKEVTLRAFRIENNEPTRAENGLLDMLTEKLTNTTVEQRRMILNENDPQQEEDLISNFDDRNNILKASVLRIMQGDETVSIPDEMFSEPKFSLSELDTLGDSAIYKGIQYVLIASDIVIVCWFGNSTIKSIQAYLNWLLIDERGTFIFELTPMCISIDTPMAKDLKEIVLSESSSTRSVGSNNENSLGSKVIDVKREAMTGLFDDIESLDDMYLDEMISARLLIKFKKKPKNMEQEEYDRIFGSLMKPMSDLEDVRYVTKSGKSVKASEIVLTKKAEVDLTSNRQINEQSLFLEMETFLSEVLRNEENNN